MQVSDKRDLRYTYEFFQTTAGTVFKTSEDGIVSVKKNLNAEETKKSHQVIFFVYEFM